MNDVVGTQRVLAELVLDDEARRQWEADPVAFAASKLHASAAALIAGLDPAEVQAMAASHSVKKVRFDYLHSLHHQHEERKAASAAPDGHSQDHARLHETGQAHTHGQAAHR